MARKLKKNEKVVFITGTSRQLGIVTDSYVRSRKRLYTVRAESGTLYHDLPVDTKHSPRYRIELALTERLFPAPAVDGAPEPEIKVKTEGGNLKGHARRNRGPKNSQVDGTPDPEVDSPTEHRSPNSLLDGT